jgi:trimethylamine--corrinoid protein Co-methyltransferase
MTLAGSVVQSIAEDLAAVVISQITKRGAPIVLGNTAMVFDMRRSTVLGGAIETAMINMAHVEVVKHLGKLSMVFMGADAKRPDVQAGLESGIGTILATLIGANLISGAGVLNNVNAQNLEMLVIDNEIRGMARRLVKGITGRDKRLAEDLFTEDLFNGNHFLESPTTMRWLKEEYFWPGPAIIRDHENEWLNDGAPTVEKKATEEVKRILATHKPEPLDEDIDREIVKIMTKAAKRHGMNKLPRALESV